jgi:hypothetical protein
MKYGGREGGNYGGAGISASGRRWFDQKALAVARVGKKQRETLEG